MRTLHAQTVPQRSVSVKRLIKLERSGRYEDALALFGEGWDAPDFLPDTRCVSSADAAEARLRFGSLIGFHGFRHQISGAQDRSKDILTEARETFLALGDIEKVAECENHIALAYWRRGEHSEGTLWVEEALSHDLPESSDARLYALLTKSLLLLADKRDHENIDLCLALEPLFRKYGHPVLNGGICANLGVSFRNLGDNEHAMLYLSRARVYHERAGHKAYLSIVQNNLALLYNAEGRFAAAHDAADSALKLYKQVKDKAREASTLDSKAQIYLTEGRFSEGLKVIERSIEMLRRGEVSAYLAESLFTKARLLAASGKLDEALLYLAEAINITSIQNSEAAARELASAFTAGLNLEKAASVTPASSGAEGVQLILPESIAGYSDYKGIWIHSGHLEKAGLPQGSLAVLVPQKVRRGDLVAVSEKATGAVSCGYYDAEFGIVCLERGDGDPLLFDAEAVEVLGKIVGLSSGKADASGNFTVVALKAS